MANTKTDKIVLEGDKRTVTGKKVKQLRREDILPANIFGAGIDSQAIQVKIPDFIKTYKAAGETQVVYIKVEKDEIPTLIRNLQMHPITGNPLHVDFQKIDLKKKVHAEVPVHFTGSSEAVDQNIGDFLTLADALEVEALPISVPQAIEVDISGLKEIDDMITIGDLKAGADYSFLGDPETPIAKIAAKQEEVVAEAPAEGEAVEGEEGEAPAEGEGGDEAGEAEGGDNAGDKAEGGDEKKEG